MRSAIAAAFFTLVTAEPCVFEVHNNFCPSLGQDCSNEKLCLSPYYCKTTFHNYTDNTYRGVCSEGPLIADVYERVCDTDKGNLDCAYDNPLKLLVRSASSSLNCVSTPGASMGKCLLGPQKHGDPCHFDAECASGICESKLSVCQGLSAGESCDASSKVNPCKAGAYCHPKGSSTSEGTCMRQLEEGDVCTSPAACEPGLYCGGPSVFEKRCQKPFSVPDGQQTTLAAFMCASANGVQLSGNADPLSRLYLCQQPNATIAGDSCDSNVAAPAGFRCSCARDHQYRLEPLGGLGLGARAEAWRALTSCLSRATDIMGKPCVYDSNDMENLRPASCIFYACFPQYADLVAVTGALAFKDPLLAFNPVAQCEIDAADEYYKRLPTVQCMDLPNLESWKCAIREHVALSVANTTILLLFIFALVFGLYFYHDRYFYGRNPAFCKRISN